LIDKQTPSQIAHSDHSKQTKRATHLCIAMTWLT